MIIPEPGMLLVEQQSTSTTQYKHNSNASNLLAIHGTFCGIAVLSVVLRLYVKGVMLKSMGSDDYTIIAAAVLSVAVVVCFAGESAAGGLGRHPALVSLPDWENFLHWRFFHSLIVMVGISLVKISIACFLRRMVPNKNYQRFLIGAIIFLVAFTISCAGTLIFNCGGHVDANWNLGLRTDGTAKCFSNITFTNIGIWNSSVNITTDVIFACLPIPIVWNLQTNMRTKITLVFILSLGLFACAASIVKTVYQAHALLDPDWTFHDSFFMWNNIEYNVGILAASLPALRPLFTKLLGVTQRFTSSNNTRGEKYGGYDADGLAYGRSKRASQNPARDYYHQFDSKQSTELNDLRRGASKRAFGDDINKVRGVTSTITAGDDDSDKIMLDQDCHAIGTDQDWNKPSNHGITKTTTVQVSTY
ncbi:phosphatidylserine decarboxylase [Exophiala viscosa]|uniref:Phosphatidylserine decarboxylase n=1 Tax=Exophiala viscosa TaxID=2486360 RepID=A0AAN6DNG7_9EURO|nr:phosphatidylserine decarboxylase [Exophiala viscosa]KAI1620975.1 phosphatidylserine decarboxylase [Exophiala viscosa]